jgi:hypothetical protein
LRLLVAAMGLALALAGCGEGEPKPQAGEAASWEVDSERPPQPADTVLQALVKRDECANGVTGRVLKPGVSEQEDRVVITFTVERTPDGDASCPGNNLVPTMVELKDPLGARPLFDGSCESPAKKSSGCKPRQVWPTR